MRPASDSGRWPQGFVLYEEGDLRAREWIVGLLTAHMQDALCRLNRAVRFVRVETPMLTPPDMLQGHAATGFDLVSAGFKKHGDAGMLLRPETTAGTYAAFTTLWPVERERRKEMPLVLWQVGKSFRDEQARPFSELRFREFYQLEYQLFASPDSKADYFGECLRAAGRAVRRVTEAEPRFDEVGHSDLAHYSSRTVDVYAGEHEVAAISARTDMPGTLVVETSVGLDRLTALRKD